MFSDITFTSEVLPAFDALGDIGLKWANMKKESKSNLSRSHSHLGLLLIHFYTVFWGPRSMPHCEEWAFPLFLFLGFYR